MTVPGTGPQPCLAMIVGEAPSREDSRAPFTGRAGRLLDTALRSFGLTTADVYLTNVVKELPLDEEERIRRPTAEEIAAWAPILEREIQNTAPAAILALGRVATDALTGTTGVLAGSQLGNVYTAWHPNWLLRLGSGASIGEFWEDYETHNVQGDWLRQIEPWVEAVRAAG